jgi:hypothetical protein
VKARRLGDTEIQVGEIARRAVLVEEFQALLPTGVSTPHRALSYILAQQERGQVENPLPW